MRLRPRLPEYLWDKLESRPFLAPLLAALTVLGVGANIRGGLDDSFAGEYVAAAMIVAFVVVAVLSAVARRRRSDAPADVVPAAPAPALHGVRLPASPGHLLGRERELAQLLDFFDEFRLVTIVGPGGTGKTALALDAADVLAPGFDAARFVDLQAVPADAAELADDVARVLNLPEAETVERLAALIGEARVLLVVDNCEHLLPPVQRLVRVLLDQCPRVVVLCTSRQPLSLAHEQLLPLRPLDPPPLDDRAAARSSAAVQLFLDHARRRVPFFTLEDDEVLDAVVRICRRLDGLPLGIVVAASLVGRRDVREVEQDLERCLGWTTPQQTGRSDQQRTLRATVGWSVGLLTAPAQDLFCRVSVFASAFSAEGARRVAVDLDVQAALDELVDHSLVVADTAPGGTRYRLLEVVRQHGLELLGRRGGLEEVRDLHLRYVADVAEGCVLALNTAERFPCLDRLTQEREEVRAALEWALTHPASSADGQRLAGAMFPYWNFTGRFQEARHWLSLAVGWSSATTLARARTLHGLGAVRFMQGLPEDREMLEQAADACRALAADPQTDEHARVHLLALILCTLAITRQRAGDDEAAVAAARESVTLFEQIGGDWGRGLALNDLGRVLFEVGQVEESDACLQASLRVWRDIDDPWGISLTLTTQAITRCMRGDTAAARRGVEEALLIQVQQDDAWGQANSHAVLATVAEHDGDLTRARDRYLDSIQRNVLLGRFASAAAALVRVASLAARMGDTTSAGLLLGACLAIRERTGARLIREQSILDTLTLQLSDRLSPEELEDLLVRGGKTDLRDLAEFVRASTDRALASSA